MRRAINLLVAACLWALGTTSSAETIATATLVNGLRVHIRADDNLKLVRVEMFFAAGRATDPDSLAGLAHLAEHLMTESSPAYPDGGLWRQSTLLSTYRNAATGPGSMYFDTQCLPQFLPGILALEVDRLRGSGLTESSFAREKAVVLEEMAFRRRLSPWSEHRETLLQACYEGHPFGEAVIGTPESVGRVTLADVEAFRVREILPHRAVLVVSGPVNAEGTLALADSLFGGLGPAAEPEHLQVPELPPAHAVQSITDSADMTGVRVSLACRIPVDGDRNMVLAAALPRLLDLTGIRTGMTSMPGEAVVYLSVLHSYYRKPRGEGWRVGYVYEDRNPDEDAQGALGYLWERIDEEMEELADSTRFEERRSRALLEPMDFRVGPAMINGNAVPTREAARAILTELTFEQWAEFVALYLTPARAGVGVTHGSDSERIKPIELARRSERTDVIAARDPLAELTAEDVEPIMSAYAGAALDPVARATLGNGIPFLYLELPDQEKSQLGGCRALAPLKIQRSGNRPGIAQLYASVVDYDDRQRRDPDAPNERPVKLPYDLDFRLRPGVLRYRADGAGDEVPDVAFQLARRLESRNFNHERWSRALRFGDDYLNDIGTDPDVVAQGWRIEQILGKDYWDLGYWRPDPGMLKKVKYKDLVDLHEKVAAETGQTVLFGTGSVPLAEMVTALEASFGDRDDFRPLKVKPPQVARVEGTAGCVVPDLTRGDVRLSLAFVPDREAPRSELVEVLLLETLLDQVLTARLRGVEGLTYAVWTEARPVSGLTMWEVDVTCQPGQAHLVLRALREELRRITTTGISADEVGRARLALTGRLFRSFDDADKGFYLLQRLATFGPVPEDLIGAAARVEDARIDDLARTSLDADRFVFTAVGPMFEEEITVFDLQ